MTNETINNEIDLLGFGLTTYKAMLCVKFNDEKGYAYMMDLANGHAVNLTAEVKAMIIAKNREIVADEFGHEVTLTAELATILAEGIVAEIEKVSAKIAELESELEDAPTCYVNEGRERGFKYASDEDTAYELDEAIAERKALIQRFESDELGEDAMTAEAFNVVEQYWTKVCAYA